jgi:hypothetical protein
MFVQCAPHVYTVPDQHVFWADGEVSLNLSNVDKANAKILTKDALAAAIGKEGQEKLEEGTATSHARAQSFERTKAAHLPPTLPLPHLLATFRSVPILPQELQAGIGPSTCPVLTSNRLSSSTACESIVGALDSFTSTLPTTPQVDSVTVGDPILKRGPCHIVPALVWPAVVHVRSMCVAMVDVHFEKIELPAGSDVNPLCITSPIFLLPGKVTT